MLGTPSNPLLAQAETGIQNKVPAPLQPMLAKVVHAGLTIMYSPKLAQQRNAALAKAGDPAMEAGAGAGRLVLNLYQQSNKTLPPALLVPAAMIFAFEYLDLLVKAGKVQITPQLIEETTQSVANAVLPAMGVTPQKLQQLMALAKNQQGAPAQGQPPAQAAPAVAPAPAPQGIIGGAQAGAQ